MMQAMRTWYLTQIATLALLFRQRDVALAYYNKILAEQPAHALTMSRVAFLHHKPVIVCAPSLTLSASWRLIRKT